MIRAAEDTHTLLWHLAADKRLSQQAREFIDNTAQGGGTIAVSTISLIEAVYLAERNRIPTETLPRIVVNSFRLTASLYKSPSIIESPL